METERKLLKIPLGFRSKIPRRGIHEYQRPENFAKIYNLTHHHHHHHRLRLQKEYERERENIIQV